MQTGSPRESPSIGIHLRRARRLEHITQEELAARAGVSARTISDIERGINKMPHLATLDLLAQALQLSSEQRAEWVRIRDASAVNAASLTSTNSVGNRSKHHLPSILTTFVGRADETRAVTALLRRPHVRLVTLTGTGGVGKTRLAIAVANTMTDDFPHGVHFVDLAPIVETRMVLTAIATTLGVQPTTGRSIDSVLSTFLRNRQTLIILDNMEHVIDAAPVVGRLLTTCASVALLVTSRVALHVQGEYVFPVSPLALPDSAGEVSVPQALRSDAVSLFVQRAQAVRPDFTVTPESAPTVAELCERLDGVPLMIELAAARLRTLPLDQIVSHLDHSLSLLKQRTFGVPERHQTLRDTIDWSYNLLSREEQALFRCASVFHGGFTLGGIAAVAEYDNELEALDVLEPLIDHGLLRPLSGIDGAPRYTMLEVLREYALEQLRDRDEESAALKRCAQHFLRFAEEAQKHLQSTEQEIWIAKIEEEHNNLRATLSWAASQSLQDDTDARVIALRIGAALWWFWYVRGHLREGREHLESGVTTGRQLLASPPTGSDIRELTNVFARCLFAYSTTLFWLADYEESGRLLNETLEIYKRLDQPREVATTTVFKAYELTRNGHHDAAEQILEEAIAQLRELNDKQGEALGLLGFGELALRRGDYDRGQQRTEESLRLFRELGDTRAITAATASIGALRLCQGDLVQSAELLRESLATCHSIGDKGGIAWALEWLARWEASQSGTSGAAARAAKLLGISRELRDTTGSAIDPADRASYAQLLRSVQRRLTDSAFVAAWESGRALQLDDAVAFALAGAGRRSMASNSQQSSVALSGRETEVLRLIAGGMSDRDIGDSLNVSPRTVNTHVTHILNKLGVMSRTAAATKAVRDGLI